VETLPAIYFDVKRGARRSLALRNTHSNSSRVGKFELFSTWNQSRRVRQRIQRMSNLISTLSPHSGIQELAVGMARGEEWKSRRRGSD